MPSTYSPNLRFELIANGEQANTWGTTTDTNIGTLIEQSIAGMATVDVTAADVTLVARNGASDQARQMIINVIGSPGTSRSVFCPDNDTKVYVVVNTSNFEILFSTVSGTGAYVPVNTSKFLYCDGSDVFEVVTAADSILLGGAPTLSLEAANKGYVDASIAALPISGLNPNRALISTAGGSFTTSGTTSTEISYLSGVTSSVQTQLNAKAPATSGSAILYGNGSGGFSNVTVGSGLQFSGGTLVSTSAGGSVTNVSVTTGNGFAGTVTNPASTPAIALSTTVSGLIKGSAGALTQASPGTDYAPATSGSQILYGNGSGGFSNVSIGSGLSFSGGTLSSTVTSGVTSVNGLTGAVSLSYANVGAPSTGGAGASGTWGINISGNAASVSNGVYNNGGTYSINISGNAASVSNGVYNNGGTYGINISGQSGYANSSGSSSYAVNLSANSGTYKVVCQGDGNTVMYINSSTARWNIDINGNGTFNTVYYYTLTNRSSIKFKNTVASYASGLAEVLKLRPVTYFYTEQEDAVPPPKEQQVGFIAEEVNDAGLTEFVAYDAEGNPESLKYANMVALLTKAIQDLNAKVESLQAEVVALKG